MQVAGGVRMKDDVGPGLRERIKKVRTDTHLTREDDFARRSGSRCHRMLVSLDSSGQGCFPGT